MVGLPDQAHGAARTIGTTVFGRAQNASSPSPPPTTTAAAPAPAQLAPTDLSPLRVAMLNATREADDVAPMDESASAPPQRRAEGGADSSAHPASGAARGPSEEGASHDEPSSQPPSNVHHHHHHAHQPAQPSGSRLRRSSGNAVPEEEEFVTPTGSQTEHANPMARPDAGSSNPPPVSFGGGPPHPPPAGLSPGTLPPPPPRPHPHAPTSSSEPTRAFLAPKADDAGGGRHTREREWREAPAEASPPRRVPDGGGRASARQPLPHINDAAE